MIPNKSKKNLKATIDEIRKFSFSYLEKYAPSKQQLRTYLLKKFFKSSNFYIAKSELLDLIDLVISDLENYKFISDKFYSQSKTKKFLKKGYSLNKIRNYLFNKGINEKHIRDSISKMNIDGIDQDFFSAIKTCKKKRIGPNREGKTCWRDNEEELRIRVVKGIIRGGVKRSSCYFNGIKIIN